MIVDDNKEFVSGMEMMLTTFFSDKVKNIYKAYNGMECLEMVHRTKPDIVFMDYSMPDLDGAVVTKVLARNNRYIKVIGVSFNKDEQTMNEMIYAGSKSFITKDEITLETIEQYLNDDPEEN
jgi:two-component system, response regulator, stage 0 sporulation protein A